jgi:hypothetical protein
VDLWELDTDGLLLGSLIIYYKVPKCQTISWSGLKGEGINADTGLAVAMMSRKKVLLVDGSWDSCQFYSISAFVHSLPLSQ